MCASVNKNLNNLLRDKHTLVINLISKGESVSDSDDFPDLNYATINLPTGYYNPGNLFNELPHGSFSSSAGISIRSIYEELPDNLLTYCIGDGMKIAFAFPGLKHIHIKSSFNIPAASFSAMFNYFEYLESLTFDSDVHFTFSSTDFESFLESCNKLKSIDMTHFDTTNVTSARYAFSYCNAMSTLDLSMCNFSSLTNMDYAFVSMSTLTSLDISSIDLTQLTSYIDTFRSVPVDCLIYVKDQASKDWMTTKFSRFTNVQIKEV